MLDIRYFDDLDQSLHHHDNNLVGYLKTPNTANKIAQTQLAPSVANLLAEFDIGGVILFSENLVNCSQITALTDDIKSIADNSHSKQPLLISIDQEGGRVARLPRDQFCAFTGNMAIGALPIDGTKFSFDVGAAIGQQLASLGINVNHAPTVDVNSNPNNPVINVRSFGDCPQRVAKLGCAMSQGMLSSGIIPTVKHFPGHGDTNVDSHTGLPLVDHDLQTVNNVDLFPFVEAIEQNCAPIIMTAHIQYPVLDSSRLTGKTGDTFIRPATLSSKILKNLLREKLNYQGVVITDALDMASISHYLSPLQTLIETFKAGADIALMPFKIHKPKDLAAFKLFFESAVLEISKDKKLSQEVMQSYQRICLLKSTYLTPLKQTGLDKQSHVDLEQMVAQQSIVSHDALSKIDFKNITTIITIFNAKEQGAALTNALLNSKLLKDKTFNTTHYTFEDNWTFDHGDSSLLITGVEDVKSVVDLGGVDDLDELTNNHSTPIGHALLSRLTQQKEQGGQSVFICLKAPYDLDEYIKSATLSLTSFDGSVYQDKTGQWTGPAFTAMAKLIVNEIDACGVMPIMNITPD